ncbi:hypothetical protein AB8Z38_10145 [Bradyrhizobium sp. LLZ17]|jgi:hypothetical protein|uniref:Uncharacterized protein n=1 Tax=Bradyrhizobium sp. LLZ17 TaxID=3239388 RepID=A0AB39XRA2_9BRAD
MSRRPTTWIIFLGFLALIGVSAASDLWNRPVQYGVWGFWLLLSAIFVWRYAHTGSSADRFRLIDTRGIYLLPQPLRRWLFGE